MRKYDQWPILIDGSGGDSGLEGSQLRQYEDLVEMCLRDCARTAVGKAVFAKIRAHGRVLIIPYTNTIAIRYKTGSLNALSFGDRESMAYAQLSLGFMDCFSTKVVAFSPLRYILAAQSAKTALGAGMRAADVLFHELVHAGRTLGGEARQDLPLTGRLARYGTEADYFAVLVTNIHMSEIGRPAPTGLVEGGSGYPGVPRTNIRADHGSGELPVALTNSDTFLSMPENFHEIKRYWSQHPAMAPLVARSPAVFNPVAAYHRWVTTGYAYAWQDEWWFPKELTKKIEQLGVINAPK